LGRSKSFRKRENRNYGKQIQLMGRWSEKSSGNDENDQSLSDYGE